MRLRILLPLLLAVVLQAQSAEQCTAAVISPAAAEGGRPMLWKNRDTGRLSNKVVYVREAPHSYLALVDAEDPSGRRAWAGLNDAGFAIMNTASYNLPQRGGDMEDLEGTVMADALRTCRTVGDFEAYLKANHGPDLGVRTNFGVLDAEGGAALFEAHGRGHVRFDAAAAPERYLVVTNFSRSGEEGQGAGYPRFRRATALMKDLAAKGPLSVPGLLQHLVRDTGHPLLGGPTVQELKALPAVPRWLHARHTINRWDTACAVILVGHRPGEPASHPVMWVVPGQPVTAPALPLFVEAGRVPEPFWKGAEAPLWAESLRVKALAHPLEGRELEEYLDLARLDNAAGSGFLPGLLRLEAETLAATTAFLAQPRRPEELQAFQAARAEAAQDALRRIR